jgi:hypothetical protein
MATKTASVGGQPAQYAASPATAATVASNASPITRLRTDEPPLANAELNGRGGSVTSSL